ncbi:MAG: SH3 domain-containing protein [Blastocatellia bacterium]
MRTVYEVDDRVGVGRGYDPVYTGSRSSGGMIALLILLFLVVLSLWNEDSWLRSRLRTAPVQVETPILAPSAPNVSIETPPVTSVGYVRADSLNMRVRPSDYAGVSFILPRGTRVTMLGEAHQELDGDVWVRVNVDTREGIQSGWVQRRYLG